MALGDRIYEDATEIYFHRRQINTARFGWALPLSLPGQCDAPSGRQKTPSLMLRPQGAPARGGTGTQARSFRSTLRCTRDRTRRDRQSRHRARRRKSETNASAPKGSTSPSTSTCERCQQFRHSKAKAPRSTSGASTCPRPVHGDR